MTLLMLVSLALSLAFVGAGDDFVFADLPQVWHKASAGRRRSGDLSS